jgi:hypothetical protein
MVPTSHSGKQNCAWTVKAMRELFVNPVPRLFPAIRPPV